MAHVGIQRLGARQGQHHCTENRHADARVHDKEVHRPGRVHRQQHFRTLDDAIDTQRTEHAEPQHHDRAENDTDACGAMLLDQKQRHQHHHRQGHDPVVDAVKGQLQPLYRRQHRNRRGDHAVAIEQRSTEQPEQHQHPAQAWIRRRRTPGQGRQGHDAAFALVVGAQHKQHVLDGDNPDQRPEHQRQNAEHAVMVGLYAVMAGEDLLEGVQRAGTDIAIDHAGSGDQQAQ
ncbi:hypothetical protein D3C79_719430 [compost metagenome]